MAILLPWLRRRIEQLRSPKMSYGVSVTMEHVQDRHLGTVRLLAVVVAVIGVPGRGQQPQPPPATLPGVGQDARQRRLGGDGEIDPLGNVRGGSVDVLLTRQGENVAVTQTRREGDISVVVRY